MLQFRDAMGFKEPERVSRDAMESNPTHNLSTTSKSTANRIHGLIGLHSYRAETSPSVTRGRPKTLNLKEPMAPATLTHIASRLRHDMGIIKKM